MCFMRLTACCPSDRCLVFNPHAHATKRFVLSLKEQFRLAASRLVVSGDSCQMSMKTLYIDSNIGNLTNQEFEFVILESALANIVNKFR